MAKKSKSIRTHLLFPVLIIMLLQAVLFLAVIFFGGVAKNLKSNSINILNENTRSSKLHMEKELVHRWINEAENDSVTRKIESFLEGSGYKAEDIRSSSELNKQIINHIMPNIIDLLHRSYATGAFLILDGPAAVNSAKGTRAGTYIRDLDTSNYAQDNSDLLLERGLPSLANKYGIALDSFWELGFVLDEQNPQNDYFYKSFNSAVTNHAKAGEEHNYGYMSQPFSLHPLDAKVISYTIPIIVNKSEVIGVIGLDMTVAQIKNFMTSDRREFSSQDFSLLGVREKGENTIKSAVTIGVFFERFFGGKDSISLEFDKKNNIYQLTSSDNSRWYASVQQLDIYNNNTPFEDEEWVYLNVVQENKVLSFYDKMRTTMALSLLFPLIFSGVCVVISGRVLTQPIQQLVEEIRNKENLESLTLKRVQIDEIDRLTDAIEELSKDVSENASKISSILEHANVPIGVFEYRKKQQNVFCSKTLYKILDWGNMEGSYTYMNQEEFRIKIESATSKRVGNSIFIINGPVPKWYKLTGVRKGDNYLGVISDVTADVMERKKLEKERDYDLLTGLFNRRAFRERALAAMYTWEMPAAMIMWDLDNLKYINDTYGHDEGDRYIVLFARQLKKLEAEGGLISRHAGDEFLTFLYDKDGMDGIRDRLNRFMEQLRTCTMEMAEGYKIPLRVSAGVAWYPKDADQYETLISYADFAMYTAKHSVKGIVLDFDKGIYSENSYLLAGKEELSRIFEEKKVKFAYQPIVDRKGHIYGYELLMRPELEKLKGINEVLNLARVQAKLNQMESLTWNVGLESAWEQFNLGTIGKDDHIFINSIGNVHLTDIEMELIEHKYGDFLEHVVIELTEHDQMSVEGLTCKTEAAARWKAQIAIDDYGSGYNSEGILLEIKPDMVKLDMSLVRNINSDKKRQLLVKSMVEYTHDSGIVVLAEGVETFEELRTLLSFQVDLFQGYYIGRPDKEVRPIDPYIREKFEKE